MRRFYQVIAWVVYALAAFVLVSTAVQLVRGVPLEAGLVGLSVAALLGVGGYITNNFASGDGGNVVGIENKAEDERLKSLVRKPQKAK